MTIKKKLYRPMNLVTTSISLRGCSLQFYILFKDCQKKTRLLITAMIYSAYICNKRGTCIMPKHWDTTLRKLVRAHPRAFLKFVQPQARFIR